MLETNVFQLKKKIALYVVAFHSFDLTIIIIIIIIITIIIKFLHVHNLKTHREQRSVVSLVIALSSKGRWVAPAKRRSIVSLGKRHQIHCRRLGEKSKSCF